ncbi:MAG: hypothetical protein QM811_31445 [Pirellulales bacterium]
MIFYVDFSPDGTTALTTSADQSARLWKASDGKPIGPPLRHPYFVSAATFDRTGENVFTAGGDRVLRRWSRANGDSHVVVSPHVTNLLAVGFAGDSDVALTLSGGVAGLKLPIPGAFTHWSAGDGRRLGEPTTNAEWIALAAFDRRGETAAVCETENTFRLWNLTTNEAIGSALEHDAAVKCLRFNSDGTRVMSGDEKGIIRFWDASSGRRIEPSLEHPARIGDVAFRSDGRAVATVCWDNRAACLECVRWKAHRRSVRPRNVGHGRRVSSRRTSDRDRNRRRNDPVVEPCRR